MSQSKDQNQHQFKSVTSDFIRVEKNLFICNLCLLVEFDLCVTPFNSTSGQVFQHSSQDSYQKSCLNSHQKQNRIGFYFILPIVFTPVTHLLLHHHSDFKKYRYCFFLFISIITKLDEFHISTSGIGSGVLSLYSLFLFPLLSHLVWDQFIRIS